MEEHRLKPMVEYDPKVFEDLYSRTSQLRKSLAFGIDANRFGVDYNEILSWFDVKFLFIFNKYYNKFDSEVLLGHLINGLKLYKCRILRKAYTHKFSQTVIPLESYHTDEEEPLEVPQTIEPEEVNNFYYSRLIEFIKPRLSDNAFYLFEIELNPPPFILHKLNQLNLSNRKKIPDSLFIEYFELGDSAESYKFIGNLRKEIKNILELSKAHFNRAS